MILKSMNIIKFRNLQDVRFDFGKHLTLIAGRNGTSKTSLLGLIVQPFSFPKKEGATIFGTPFDTDFSDIHRITKYDTDGGGTIKDRMRYEVVLQTETVPVAGYTEKANTPKSRHRFKAGKSEQGQGNRIYPTIYLGLKRLVPLGEHSAEDSKVPIERKRVINKLHYDEEEREFYSDIYTQIFGKITHKIAPETVVTQHKSSVGGQMGNYDSQSFSAGQDSFGQIMGAILSFKRLKREMGAAYPGGIICIDEVETTFHPVALENIFKVLRAQAVCLNLQIIMTTHSLPLIKLAYSKDYKDITNVVYLKNMGPHVTAENNPSYNFIESDMYLQAPRFDLEPSIYLVCEDDEAKTFLEVILLNDLKSQVRIISAKLGGENLETISKSGLKDVANLIFILDGDKNKSGAQIFVFPNGAIPERVLYEILEDKQKNDSSFWEGSSPDLYFNRFSHNPYTHPYGNKKNRDVAKEFFKHVQEINPNIIGKAFRCWCEDNKKAVADFNSDIEKQIVAMVKLHKK